VCVCVCVCLFKFGLFYVSELSLASNSLNWYV
jgi:hypothetical protein